MEKFYCISISDSLQLSVINNMVSKVFYHVFLRLLKLYATPVSITFNGIYWYIGFLHRILTNPCLR